MISARIFVAAIVIGPIFYGLWTLHHTQPFITALIAGGLFGFYHHFVLITMRKHVVKGIDAHCTDQRHT